jgi:CysZ protein
MKQQALGFWRGFSTFFGAVRSLFRLTSAWPYACVPVVVFVLLETLFVYLSIQFVKPWLDARLAFSDDWNNRLGAPGGLFSWLAHRGAQLGVWLGTLAAAALGWLVSLVLAPPFSAPALERIVGITERDLGLPERAPLGFFAEFWCGLRSTLLSSAVTVPLIVVLTAIELVAPPAAVLTTPLKLLIGALGVAWTLFDYPLTLRGVRARERLALMRQHSSLVLGFGTAFALVAYVACCNVAMLPVGVIAATQLLAQIDRASPRRQ